MKNKISIFIATIIVFIGITAFNTSQSDVNEEYAIVEIQTGNIIIITSDGGIENIQLQYGKKHFEEVLNKKMEAMTKLGNNGYKLVSSHASNPSTGLSKETYVFKKPG